MLLMSEEEPVDLFGDFKIGEDSFPNKVREHLDVRTQPINDSFCEHAELFSWYATAYELALDSEVRSKEELARLYAVTDHSTRMNAKSAGVKMTEKMVENTVITDPQYVDMLSTFHDNKRNTGLLKAARDAMLHRRDMLIQMGATYRAEGLSDLTLKEQFALKQGNK
jgi:hypothetical protein